MKFISITDEELSESKGSIASEYKSSRKIGRIGLGDNHLFSRKWFTVKFISYSDIYRVFRRVECVDMKMCCAKGELHLENIVLCNKKEELIQIDLPNEKAAKAVLEEIQKHNPEVKIGVKK